MTTGRTNEAARPPQPFQVVCISPEPSPKLPKRLGVVGAGQRTFHCPRLVQLRLNGYPRQLKLDELIRVSAEARNRLINLEDLTEDEMDKVKKDLTAAAAEGRADPEGLKVRTSDDGQRGRE